MSEVDHDWIDALERTHKAVRGFAQSELGAYANKIAYRMKRFPASGIYGDDPKHRTLWDEYCYEQHHGPTEALASAWDRALKPYLDEILEAIAADTAVLLSIYSAWELGAPLEICGSVWPDGMSEILRQLLVQEAMGRSTID